jgi:hypothetical protein
METREEYEARMHALWPQRWHHVQQLMDQWDREQVREQVVEEQS